jgi:C1A family cysteine protease
MFLRLTVLATFLAVAVSANLRDRAFYEEKFFDWLAVHKVAANSGEHFVQMLQNFANNEDIITTHNSGNNTYTLGHNQFSSMSLDEWRAYVKLGLGKKDPSEPAANVLAAPADLSALPASVDWTTQGAVTGVKDQGQCGSCWSFSATGAVEGAYKLKYSNLISFSEQMFVDCDNRSNGGKDMACNGGLMDSAFDFAKKWGGISTEGDYPYVSGTTKKAGTCNTKIAKNANAAPKSYTDVQVNSDSAMMTALAKQPVSVAIEADQSAFQLYKSGVFTAACGTNLDHGVLAVGYGALNGVDYYKVKNSWGTTWGDAGYILLARGISQKQGQCGILSGPPSFPNM